MKLNDDCLVAVLEAVEESCTYYEPFRYNFSEPLHDKLKAYTHDQILYHIHYCDEFGYLEGCSILGNGAMIIVTDLSKDGHAYLKEVRSKGIVPTIKSAWEEHKKDNIWTLICAAFKGIVELIKKVAAQ